MARGPKPTTRRRGRFARQLKGRGESVRKAKILRPRGAPASISSSDGTTRGGRRSSAGLSGAGFRFTAWSSRAGGEAGRDAAGSRAGGWARQGKDSPQESSTVARMIVTLPIRSIGRGSFPVPPDRNAQRGHSGLRGRRRLYRLIPVRMLMTNAAILSPHSDPLAGPELGVAAKGGAVSRFGVLALDLDRAVAIKRLTWRSTTAVFARVPHVSATEP